jgi:hypothetical protein
MLFNSRTRACDLAVNVECKIYNYRLMTPPTNVTIGTKNFLDNYCPLDIVYNDSEMANLTTAGNSTQGCPDCLFSALTNVVSEFKDSFAGYQQNIKDFILGFLLNLDWTIILNSNSTLQSQQNNSLTFF